MPEIQENFLKGIVTSPSEYHVDEISVKIIKKKYTLIEDVHKTTVRITIRMLKCLICFNFHFK